jgi:hypothetical protein
MLKDRWNKVTTHKPAAFYLRRACGAAEINFTTNL